MFLEDLATASGIATPTREDLARVDRKRKKKGSNKDWQNPHDPDAQITKMKDGRTHLAHKQEHTVDMDTGAVVTVTVTGGAEGDTLTVEGTLEAAKANLAEAKKKAGDDTEQAEEPEEAVADKGGVPQQGRATCAAAVRLAMYISEPDRGRQHWIGEEDARDAVYSNRRRKRGCRGQVLMRRRGEILERTFAHTLDAGGLRRATVRGHVNVAKRARSKSLPSTSAC